MKIFSLILLLSVMILLAGCTVPDQNILNKLAALETQAAALKTQSDNLVKDIKAKGLTPESVTELLGVISAADDIRNQINDIRKESSGGTGSDWFYIIVSMISGLTGYPIMRTFRRGLYNGATTTNKTQ